MRSVKNHLGKTHYLLVVFVFVCALLFSLTLPATEAPTAPQDTSPAATLPALGEELSPTVPEQAPPNSAPPAETLPAEPPNEAETLPLTPTSPTRLYQHIGVLIVDDQVGGNQYVTTLDSGGTSLPGSQPPALFGVRQNIGRNTTPATWFPHVGHDDLAQIVQVLPREAFRGVSDGNANRLEGEFIRTPLPTERHSNLIFSENAFDFFKQQPVGAQQTLSLTELLTDGSERYVEAQITQQARLILRRPLQLNCQDETIEGIPGKVCLIREIEGEHLRTQGGDIHFILRGQIPLQSVRYRIGQQWYPLGTPIPIAEFAQGKGIEFFFSLPSSSELNYDASNTSPLTFNLEGGFYSSSRHSKGDRFAINLGVTPGSHEQSVYHMSRMELLLIRDEVDDNQYITTLQSSGNQGKGALLYGVQNPKGGERSAIWYVPRLPGVSFEQPQTPTLTPEDSFDGYRDEAGHAQAQPTLNVQLSPAGWLKLHTLASGQNQLWRYANNLNQQHYLWLSHVLKTGQLTLTPGSRSCRTETLEGQTGQLCQLRGVEWSGFPTNSGDLRFILNSKLNSPLVRYRVAEQWVTAGQSVPFGELSQSKGIELFFVPPDTTDLPARLQPVSLSGQIQMSFFSASRTSKGDRFTLSAGTTIKPTLPESPQDDPLDIQHSLSLLLVKDAQHQTQYVTTLHASAAKNSALYGAQHPKGGERPAVWYTLLPDATVRNQTLGANPLPAPSPALLEPAEFFEKWVEGQGGVNETGSYPHLTPLFWQTFSSMGLGEDIMVQQTRESGRLQSRLNKQAELTFSTPTLSTCVPEKVEEQAGLRCTLSTFQWQGASPDSEDIRLDLQSSQELSNARYRVAQRWYRLGESLPVRELAEGKHVELFFTATPQSEATNESSKSEPLQLTVYSNERRQQGDFFTLTFPLPIVTPSAPSNLAVEEISLNSERVNAGDPLGVTVRFNRPPVESDTLFWRLSPLRKAMPQEWQGDMKLGEQVFSLPTEKWIQTRLQPSGTEDTLTFTLTLPKDSDSGDFSLEVTTRPPMTLQSRTRLSRASSPSPSAIKQATFQIQGRDAQARNSKEEFYLIANNGKQATFMMKRSWWSRDTILALIPSPSPSYNYFLPGTAQCEGFNETIDVSVARTSSTLWPDANLLPFYKYLNDTSKNYNFKTCRVKLGIHSSVNLNQSVQLSLGSFMYRMGGISINNPTITFTPSTIVNNVDRVSNATAVSGETTKFRITLFSAPMTEGDTLSLTFMPESSDAANFLDLTNARFISSSGIQYPKLSTNTVKVNLNKGVDTYDLEIDSSPFFGTGNKSFTIFAGLNSGPMVSGIGTLQPSKELVKSVSSSTVLKGDKALFTVTLARKLPSNTALYFQVPDAQKLSQDLQLSQAQVLGIPLNLSSDEVAVTLPVDTERFDVEIPSVKKELEGLQNKIFYTLNISSQAKNRYAPKGTGVLYPWRTTQPTNPPQRIQVQGGTTATLTLPLQEASLQGQQLGINYQQVSTLPAPVRFHEAKIEGQDLSIPASPDEQFFGTGTASSVKISIPTEVFYADESRSFRLNFRGALEDGSIGTSATEITVLPHPKLMVAPLSPVEGLAGGRVRLLLKTDRLPKAGDALFFKLGFSQDGVKPQDLALDEILFSTQSGTPLKTLSFSAPYELSIPFDDDQETQEFVLEIPINTLTSQPSKSRTFTVSVNGGRTAESHPAVSTVTLLPVTSDITLSVDSPVLSGEMDTQPRIQKTLLLDWKLGTIQMDMLPLKQRIEQRALQNPAYVSLDIQGEPASDTPDLCLLTITAGTPLGKKVKFPAYLSYPLTTGQHAQVRHGCGTRPVSLQDAQWKRVFSSTTSLYHYQLPVELVFELNHAVSQSTTDALPWQGSASTILNLRAQTLWNAQP